jgi:hypothetical protein
MQLGDVHAMCSTERLTDANLQYLSVDPAELHRLAVRQGVHSFLSYTQTISIDH